MLRFSAPMRASEDAHRMQYRERHTIARPLDRYRHYLRLSAPRGGDAKLRGALRLATI